MSDIVERLHYWLSENPACIEAADEITRLRAIEKAARDYYMGYVQDEAAEWEVCVDERQHERAIALRDALGEK